MSSWGSVGMILTSPFTVAWAPDGLNEDFLQF